MQSSVVINEVYNEVTSSVKMEEKRRIPEPFFINVITTYLYNAMYRISN